LKINDVILDEHNKKRRKSDELKREREREGEDEPPTTFLPPRERHALESPAFAVTM